MTNSTNIQLTTSLSEVLQMLEEIQSIIDIGSNYDDAQMRLLSRIIKDSTMMLEHGVLILGEKSEK